MAGPKCAPSVALLLISSDRLLLNTLKWFHVEQSSNVRFLRFGSLYLKLQFGCEFSPPVVNCRVSLPSASIVQISTLPVRFD